MTQPHSAQLPPLGTITEQRTPDLRIRVSSPSSMPTSRPDMFRVPSCHVALGTLPKLKWSAMHVDVGLLAAASTQRAASASDQVQPSALKRQAGAPSQPSNHLNNVILPGQVKKDTAPPIIHRSCLWSVSSNTWIIDSVKTANVKMRRRKLLAH